MLLTEKLEQTEQDEQAYQAWVDFLSTHDDLPVDLASEPGHLHTWIEDGSRFPTPVNPDYCGWFYDQDGVPVLVFHSDDEIPF